MSTIKVIDNTYKLAGGQASAVKSLTLFDEQVEAMIDLIYGTTTRPQGFSPGHDHQEDGGESLLRPILSHCFGQYRTEEPINFTMRGLPICLPPAEEDASLQKTYAPVVVDGYSDPSGAKRIYSSVVMVPGGCLGVRISLLMANTNFGNDFTFAGVFRHMQGVNFKLGKDPSEVNTTITITRSGAASNALYNFSADVTDLSELGDPSQDRELDFSLWLTSDEGFNFFDDLICHLEIIPRYFTGSRQPRADDRATPKMAVREVQQGVGIFSPVLGAKVRAIYNNLNRALWGTSPGLLPNGQPDPRRRYLETIDDVHRHQGINTPDIDGTIYPDGAVLADYQSFGFIQRLGLTTPVSSTPTADSNPVIGRYLHTDSGLASGWTKFGFRRSIPSGLGALLMRFGVMPSTLKKGATLLVKVNVIPVDGGSDIMVRTQCGSYQSEDDSTEADYQYCELVPRDDPAYVPNKLLFRAGAKGWNRGAEIAANRQDQLGMNAYLMRVSEPLLVRLTYPPLNPLDTRHKTGDYDISVRFKLRLTAGGSLYDTEAACQFISCWSMPGF